MALASGVRVNVSLAPNHAEAVLLRTGQRNLWVKLELIQGQHREERYFGRVVDRVGSEY